MTDQESFLDSFESWSNEKSKTLAWKLFIGPLSDYTIKVEKMELINPKRILIWSRSDNKPNHPSLILVDKILSFEQINNELIEWNDIKYITWLENRIKWTNELFQQL